MRIGTARFEKNGIQHNTDSNARTHTARQSITEKWQEETNTMVPVHPYIQELLFLIKRINE